MEPIDKEQITELTITVTNMFRIIGMGLRFLFILCASIGMTGSTLADELYHRRVFTANDGLNDTYASAIAWSPRGNIWVKHRDTDSISVMDGFSVQTLPSPGKDSYRIYESRTGQLWSLYPDGLAKFIAKQWVYYYIPEIRSEIQSQPLRRVRQIPLVPAEHNRVLFLLSDRLMQFDSAREKVLELKNVESTGLGRFIEMTEARDGGLWISGASGLAKVIGPLRQISAASQWRIENIAARLGASTLQRLFEDDHNRVATVASDTRGASQRVLLQFDGTDWRRTEVPGENTLQAWPGWDHDTWAYTIDSLLRFPDDQSQGKTKERVWMGQNRDAALEPNGAFWLATSEGVARYGPYLWRRPDAIERGNSPVHAAFESLDGALWFASTDALIILRNNTWTVTEWPEDFVPSFQRTDRICQLRDGRIAITGGDRALLFNPAQGRFEYLSHPDGRRIRFLGNHNDGTLWTQSDSGPPDAPVSIRLERFDGQEFLPSGFESQVDISRGMDFVFTSRRGDVWIGTTGAITRLHSGQVEIFGDSEGFYGYQASCHLEVDETRIWFGGAGKIIEFDGEKWSVVRTGLEQVNRLCLSSSGLIWAATSSGLYAYSEGSWVPNGVEEGLPTSVATEVIEDSEGRLWAGTTLGISLHQPNADQTPPETLVPVLMSSDESAAGGTTLFRLGAVDKWNYTKPEHLLFSHRIDEGAWSAYTNTTTAAYENLRAGKHRFEVRALDRNWNRDVLTAYLDFAVVVPWHKEPRIVVVLACGLILVLFFAGLAVNRHLQLTRSYAEVEKIVGIRTQELEKANQELLHSQKMRALGTLAAGISHDFNNILSIIKGSAQLIEQHIDDKSKIRARVGRIKTMVDQGTGIVRSILGLGRVAEQDSKPCDLNALVTDTIKLLGDESLHEISIHFEPSPSLPHVPGVKEMIQQILLNLLLNAVDAMSGVGSILIRTTQSNRPPEKLFLAPISAPNYVLITIRDSGIGIDEETLPRIFEPFFTTKALSTRRGTGLGLTMVYELAKELGYGLHVDSTVGKGTTFTIIVPVR